MFPDAGERADLVNSLLFIIFMVYLIINKFGVHKCAL